MAPIPNQQQGTPASDGHGPIAQHLAVLQAQKHQSAQPPATSLPKGRNQTGQKKRYLGWTGFTGKTLWEWLQLLIVPLILAGGGFWFSYQQNQTSLQVGERQYQNDRQIAQDQQQEATLKTYLDDMSDLLLNHHLLESKPGDEVVQVARERTLTTLRRLEAKRNRIVLQFLQDTGIIGRSSGSTFIKLSNADLSGADLSRANLIYTDLSQADLSGADLSGADLVHSDLSYAHLIGARLIDASLPYVDLSGADLSRANLIYVSLSGAELHGANLSKAQLTYTDLSKAELHGANLSGVDLSNSNLNSATVTKAQLAQAASLSHTILPDGSKHP